MLVRIAKAAVIRSLPIAQSHRHARFLETNKEKNMKIRTAILAACAGAVVFAAMAAGDGWTKDGAKGSPAQDQTQTKTNTGGVVLKSLAALVLMNKGDT
jgi:hypothetical protein